jgi:hypothetical protein
MKIELPFPPASLSGHAGGNWRGKATVTHKHRTLAHLSVLALGGGRVRHEGDIEVLVTFYPPDRRSDRLNFPNRMKPYFDGIAAALGVNDKRFVPAYKFAEPEKPGRVCVEVKL